MSYLTDKYSLLAQDGVHADGRLVQDHDGRLVHHGDRQGHSPLLAAAETEGMTGSTPRSKRLSMQHIREVRIGQKCGRTNLCEKWLVESMSVLSRSGEKSHQFHTETTPTRVPLGNFIRRLYRHNKRIVSEPEF